MYNSNTSNDKIFGILLYSYCALVTRDNVKMTLWRSENAYNYYI